MNRVSNMLYLVLITAVGLLGCDDSTDQPTKTRLDLKGFQIIQETDGEALTVSGDDLKDLNTLDLGDSIGAGDYPANTRLISIAKCSSKSGHSDSGRVQPYEMELPFDGPIPLLQVLPEEIMFNPKGTQGAKTYNCILNLKAADVFGNMYILSTPIVGDITDKKEYANLDLKSSGLFLPTDTNSEKYPEIKKSDLYQVEATFSGETDVRSIKLVCETFYVEHELNFLSKNFSLKEVDLKQAQFISSDPDQIEGLKSIQNQPCRLLVYDKSAKPIGYSTYFNFHRPDVLPKLFQISFRTSSQEVPQVTQNAEFAKLSVVDASGQISASTYPPGIQLRTSVDCRVGRPNAEVKTYKKETIRDFTGPVSFLSLLPPEAHFSGSHDFSENVQCLFRFDMIDKGDRRHDYGSLNVIISDSFGHKNVEIRDNGNPLFVSNGQPPFVERGELSRYSLNGTGGTRFDSYQLMCDTFSLSDKSQGSDYMDMKAIDFSKIDYGTSDPAQIKRAQATYLQTCRFVIFDKNVVVGFSPYFQLKQEELAPTISYVPHPAKQYLGINLGGGDVRYHQQAFLGEFHIGNPHAIDIFVAVQQNETLAKIQMNGETPTYSGASADSKAMVYDVYVNLQQITGFEFQSLNDGRVVHKIPAGEVLKISYSVFNFSSCEVFQKFIDPRTEKEGMRGGTYGMFFKVYNPLIQLLAPSGNYDINQTAQSNQVIWTYGKGSQSYSGYIFSTDGREFEHSHYENLHYIKTDFEGNAIIDNCNTGGAAVDLR